MPNLKQVIDVLETLYPLRYAEEWDEPGLIVGDLNHEVNRIVFAADPTSAIVDKAVATGADLLVTHHPLFFRSVHEASGLGFRGDIVRRLYQHGCGLWVGHTNADAAYRGVGQAAADYFGLVGSQPLVPIEDTAAAHPVGLGRVGRLPEPITLKDFAQRVFDEVSDHGMVTALGIQMCGDPEALVRRIAILPGSGDSLFNEVRETGADVYVTSDLRHHPVTDAIEQARYEARMRGQGIALGQGRAVMGMCVLISSTHRMLPSNPCGSIMRLRMCLLPSNGRQVLVPRLNGSATRLTHGRCPSPPVKTEPLQ